MANPYDFITTTRGDIFHHPRSPHNFLPPPASSNTKEIFFGQPPLCNLWSYTNQWYHPVFILHHLLLQTWTIHHPSPEHAKIFGTANITDAQKSYIAQYKNTAATIYHYFKTNLPNDRSFERMISEWKSACNKLIENPHFTDGWDLPAFYPFYMDACDKAITDFFMKQKEAHPNKLTFCTKRMQHAKEMHIAWQQMFLYIPSA